MKPPVESKESSVDQGFFVDLEKTPDGNLKIRLTEDGHVNFKEIELEQQRSGTHAALYRLLEDHLANGWELLPPEDIGALTSAPILSSDVERNDRGTVSHIGRVYWFPQYVVQDEIEELKRKAFLLFEGVS